MYGWPNWSIGAEAPCESRALGREIHGPHATMDFRMQTLATSITGQTLRRRPRRFKGRDHRARAFWTEAGFILAKTLVDWDHRWIISVSMQDHLVGITLFDDQCRLQKQMLRPISNLDYQFSAASMRQHASADFSQYPYGLVFRRRKPAQIHPLIIGIDFAIGLEIEVVARHPTQRNSKTKVQLGGHSCSSQSRHLNVAVCVLACKHRL